MSEFNKAVVRSCVEEVINQGNLALIEKLYSADSIYHGASFPKLRGREARKEHFASIRRGFPDFHFTVDDLIAEGSKVVLCWSFVGTHRGEFWGVAPTGKKVSFSGTSTCQIADGMITEEFVQWDALGYMQQIGTAPASTEANKAVVRRYMEEIANQANLALIDKLFSADSIWQGPNFPELRGREARKEFFASMRKAFPDIRFTVDELIAEGDKVVLLWSNSGTHRGEWWGVAPTGKKVSFGGTSTYRFADGMITEEFMQHDALGVMQQLGVVPALSQAAGAPR